MRDQMAEELKKQDTKQLRQCKELFEIGKMDGPDRDAEIWDELEDWLHEIESKINQGIDIRADAENWKATFYEAME